MEKMVESLLADAANWGADRLQATHEVVSRLLKGLADELASRSPVVVATEDLLARLAHSGPAPSDTPAPTQTVVTASGHSVEVPK